tara:strand:+ start:118 stop:1152 length:1035 start_codon:yes stop_codon:yes gene_type:complete
MRLKTKANTAAQNNKKDTFILNHHKGIPSFGLNAESRTKPFKTTTVKVGSDNTPVMTFAEIPKSHLGINIHYQRNLDVKRVNRIKADWDYDIYTPASVYQKKKNGKFYYQVTDGQHRVAAYPDDIVLVRIVNSLPAVKRFLQANNPKCIQALTYDQIFWAVRYGTHYNGLNFKDYPYTEVVIKNLKRYGWEPQRYSIETKDFGAKTSTLYKGWLRNVVNPLTKKLKGRRLKEESEKVFSDTLEIMTAVMGGTDAFHRGRYGGQMWAAMMDFLVNPVFLGNNYSVKSVITSLSKGLYKRPNSRQAIQHLTKLSEWMAARSDYTPILNNIEKEYRQLINDVYQRGE